MAIDTTCSSDVISSFDDDNNNIDDVGCETEERELIKKNENSLNHTSGNEFGAINSFLKDFHQQRRSHARRPGLLSFKSQSLGQMVVKKVIGMDGG